MCDSILLCWVEMRVRRVLPLHVWLRCLVGRHYCLRAPLIARPSCLDRLQAVRRLQALLISSFPVFLLTHLFVHTCRLYDGYTLRCKYKGHTNRNTQVRV